MPAKFPEDAHRLFLEAFNSSDADAVAELYEPDAVMCNAKGELRNGQAGIRERFKKFLGSRPKITLQTRFVLRMGDIALLRSDWQDHGNAFKRPSSRAKQAPQYGSSPPPA
jgi:uncharacterized protein (TIGR02246 family)